jgi:opacity protein-like surface antigen
MKKLLTKSTFALVLSTGFIACQKEKQEAAPVVQEQSTTLNQGNGIMETVQRGPNGTNVVFSNWIQKTDPDWFIWGSGKYTTEMLTTSLTDAVRDKGLVLVYFNLSGINAQLPNQSMGENIVLDYHFETGKITARYTYGGGSLYGNNILTVKFRYILIPSSSFGNGRISKPVDYSDYNAVCEYYCIPK